MQSQTRQLKKSTPTKLGFRPDEAAEVIGSPQLLTELVQAGWLKPVLQRHKLTLYDGDDLTRCWTRLLAGERLPLRDCARNPRSAGVVPESTPG